MLHRSCSSAMRKTHGLGAAACARLPARSMMHRCRHASSWTSLLQCQSNARDDQGQIDEPAELLVVELLEYLQAQIGTRNAGQRIGNNMSVKNAALADQAQSSERQHLQNEDIGLVNGALGHLVPATHAAPNGDERTGESGQRSGYSAQRPN